MLTQFKKNLNFGANIWVGIVLLLSCIAAWYLFLDPRYEKDAGFFSCLYGLMSWVVIWAVRMVSSSENEKALDRAIKGSPPEDGAWSAVSGIIHSSTPGTLTAPFSGQTVLAYKYWVTYLGHRITGRVLRRVRSETTFITAFSGFAIAPCEIHTTTGSIRIKGMPTINHKSNTLSGPEVYERACSYINSTVFKDVTQSRTPDPDGTDPSPILSMGSSEIVKEDKCERTKPDLKNCSFNEIVILPGNEICAYGLYSAEQNCLHAPDKISSGRLFILVAGNVEKAKESLRGQRTFFYGVILVFLTILIIIAWCA